MEHLYLSTRGLTRRPTSRAVFSSICFTFQLAASRGGRQKTGLTKIMGESFQLAASRGGRHPRSGYTHTGGFFQLAASRGGRRERRETKRKSRVFQLAASRGGRLGEFRTYEYDKTFNSRPHEEADILVPPFFLPRNVLSTRGLTRRPTFTLYTVKIPSSFQLAASRGGRLSSR